MIELDCFICFDFVYQHEYAERLLRLNQCLQEHYTSNENIDRVIDVRVGVYCCCVHNSIWHRCQILKLYPNRLCKVRSIDDGRTIKSVKWSDLRMIEPDFLEIAPLATHCSLVCLDSNSEIKRWAPNEHRHFKEKLRQYSEIFVCPSSLKTRQKIGIFLYYRDEDRKLRCLNGMFGDNDGDSTSDEVMEEHIMMKCPDIDIYLQKTSKYSFTARSPVLLSHFERFEEVYIIFLSKLEKRNKLHINIQQIGASIKPDESMYTYLNFLLRPFAAFATNYLLTTNFAL